MLNDSTARRTALLEINRTLMVEAGAGSGKTSLMAGRIISMLANGVHPRDIAAVSFTEMAAAELMGRVSDTIDDVLKGTPPADLRASYDGGNIDPEGQTRLQEAQHHLGEMTCTTIHGFCKRLLKPYPVEADIDPGAAILDATQASLLFEDVFNEWIRERLNSEDYHKDIITEMVATHSDTKEAIETIRRLADQLRGSPDLFLHKQEFDLAPANQLIDQIEKYEKWIAGLGFEAEGNEDIRADFAQLRKELLDAMGLRKHQALMNIIRLKLSSSVLKADGGFRVYKMKGKWQAAAPSKKVGEDCNTEATERYNEIAEGYQALKTMAASAALTILEGEIRPMLERYRDRKRQGAALDFEDLLVATRQLLQNYPEIATALGQRYKHVLVDEFQDTDPVQTEIFKHLCFDRDADGEWVPRPGAIFLVGDPKQGIYRFRGADVKTYLDMRNLLEKHDSTSILKISTNFRSSKGILDYVNDVFDVPLSAPSQPGFTALDPFRQDTSKHPSVATIKIGELDNIAETRDEEARQIAEMARRLINTFPVFDKKLGATRPCKPSDIALLAPTGSDLWRYEHALEEEGISVATQAGKGMFQRQEVQDMIAITRVLADPRDHLALGALLRGPLVGMTETELLDASHSLPKLEDGGLTHLHVGIDTGLIKNPVLKTVMAQLNALRGSGKYTTPYDVLSSAVDVLNVRATVKARHAKSPHRALANVDRFLEMSRPYTTRGLRAFSDEVRSLWEDGERIAEAHPDGEDQSVSIITMHSSKGLEWPVVFVINTMTEIMRSRPLVVDVSSRQISMPFFGFQPSGYSELKQISDVESHNERVRLLYVATTRARDLLVVPVHEKTTERQWATVTDLKLQDIHTMELESFSNAMRVQRDVTVNNQDAKTFAEQTAAILAAKKPIINKTPSRHESHASSLRISLDDLIDAEPVADPSEFVQGSAERGIVMHKLMEEILTGELKDNEPEVENRARELIQQMIAFKEDEIKDMDARVMAKEIMQTLALPQIASIRHRLVPEVATSSSYENDKIEGVTFGIMDAADISDRGEIETVIDWKSDRSPTAAIIEFYRDQMSDYMKMNSAKRGLIVFMASGKIIDIAA